MEIPIKNLQANRKINQIEKYSMKIYPKCRMLDYRTSFIFLKNLIHFVELTKTTVRSSPRSGNGIEI